jgi:restriction endonuclease S subunit
MLFVTSENVLYDEIDLKDGKYLPLAFNTKQRRSQLRRRDVLINLVGASIGRLAMFDVEVEVANVNQAVGVFRCDPSKALPEFIVQYLLKGDNNLRLVNNQSESARPNLSLTDLREFEFRLPSINEQKKRLIRIHEIKETVKSSKRQIASSQLLIKSLINQIF